MTQRHLPGESRPQIHGWDSLEFCDCWQVFAYDITVLDNGAIEMWNTLQPFGDECCLRHQSSSEIRLSSKIHHLQRPEQTIVRKRWIFQFTSFANLHCLRNTIFRRIRKIVKSDYQLHVCPSVRIKQLCIHWKDFHEIWYLFVFRKSVENFQVSLISDKNAGHFTLRTMYIFDHISFKSA